jgi:hypothetical protein
MSRNLSSSLIAAVLLLAPANLFAGGRPILILPVDGVNSTNAQACVDLLNARLKDKFWEHGNDPQTVRIVERKHQSFVAFDMGGDVTLGDVQAALEGSKFSIPQDRLHFFGHVVLEIDAKGEARQALLSDLDALAHLSVAESKTENGVLRVTIDMPYPADRGRGDLNTAGWDTFQRNDFASDQSTRKESPVTLQKLPRYSEVRDVVEKHDARLKEVRWSADYSCRPLGGVAEPASATKPVQVGSTNQ